MRTVLDLQDEEISPYWPWTGKTYLSIDCSEHSPASAVSWQCAG